VTLSAI